MTLNIVNIAVKKLRKLMMSDKKFWWIMVPVCVLLLCAFSFSLYDGVKEQRAINAAQHV